MTVQLKFNEFLSANPFLLFEESTKFPVNILFINDITYQLFLFILIAFFFDCMFTVIVSIPAGFFLALIAYGLSYTTWIFRGDERSMKVQLIYRGLISVPCAVYGHRAPLLQDHHLSGFRMNRPVSVIIFSETSESPGARRPAILFDFLRLLIDPRYAVFKMVLTRKTQGITMFSGGGVRFHGDGCSLRLPRLLFVDALWCFRDDT